MKTLAALILLCAIPQALAQAKKPAHPETAKAEAKPAEAAKPAPPPADVVTPHETVDSLKLQLALEKQKSLQEQAQSLNQQAMQAIEPRMAPLRAQYQAQLAAVKDEEQKVRRENGYGPDVELDQVQGSPTYGQWVKKKQAEKK